LRVRLIAKVLLSTLLGWVLLSVVLFFISATRAPGESQATKDALAPAGFMLTTPSNILILGSDQRTPGSKEPGATTSGPSRSDVMLLVRAGGGKSARLSIPRDMVVNLPGHGEYKINAAYAFGGAALSIKTVESFLGIAINHVVEINFEQFPKFVDAMGGVNFTNHVSGGFRDGGYTLRLSAGTHHLNGTQALALARTRDNLCNPSEDDLTRVVRQQELFQDMKDRLLSPAGFIRLPWEAWAAPPTLKTDMSPLTLLSLFASLETSGAAKTGVLEPDGTTTLPDGETALTVSTAEKQAAVARFLAG
jgi:LCP family protein required for cell wall assembly